jgi:metal-responsive CopG/Arc/MetJ family transcriptional regulator
MEPHYGTRSSKVKTTVLFEKSLLEEIDEFNPFKTRKDFLDQACKIYLNELRRRVIDEKLAQACSEAEAEDRSVNEEWEPIVLEGWK